MKFGHAFKEALQGDSYPQHWVETAIPYRQLKKVLGEVREELIRKGYDPDTIHRLLADHNAEYILKAGDSRFLKPKLVVRPVPDLSQNILASLKELAESAPSLVDKENESAALNPDGDQQRDSGWVKIPLNADAQFFDILQTDVDKLDELQSQEQKSMNSEIALLGDEIAGVAKPNAKFIKFSKTDLYRWREIFEIYLAAQIFFSTTEVNSGARCSEKARKQLVWFQDEVNKRELPHKFKLESSAAAYSRFMALNATLLQNLQFQELNQTAIVKIIKKFDKQTSLGVKSIFPEAMTSASFIADNVAKGICAQLSQEVVTLVPQTVDYTCSICLSICWLPIRLHCNHLFCIRCVVKMQNRNKRTCPLCRANTVLRATTDNIDDNLVNFLEKWFPKETKEKQLYNEIERGKELFGEGYVHQPCIIM
ncbi:SPX domain-containing protein [Diplogelasinospora grovesii]|uniref:SPX domain-containing protein n=1 Tax=Diplogelasinospora grovesii TaxID=303347 RepID=A0AAN6N8I1_9PEZI|nr:SPX domain-containing protein [Diplogelasinospora grovesii]